MYCKTCLTSPLKNRQKKEILMTNGSLMKVERININDQSHNMQPSVL